MPINFNSLLKNVFDFRNNEKITIVYDTPWKQDTFEWQERRKLALAWNEEIKKIAKTEIAYYKATYANNADLPEKCFLNGKEISFDELMSNTSIIIALTEFSATAPLVKYAQKYEIRAASMPKFNKTMIKALELDYSKIAKDVEKIYSLLLSSEFCNIFFSVKGKKYELFIDLRYRKPKKDDGNCKEKGKVINLPSGESFIVPYEGEQGESRTRGILPIQKNKEVIFYEVKNNKIISSNKKDDELFKKIQLDSAVGNIAELAFGVLSKYGIESCGKTLLDEKLGLHIALGRSEHLGGITGTKEFKNKENVWHQDFVYTKDIQPLIDVNEVRLNNKLIIKNNNYVIL